MSIQNDWELEQLELKSQLVQDDVIHFQLNPNFLDTSHTLLQRIAGVDISFVKDSNVHACASIVILAYPSMQVLYEAYTYVALESPYIPGFLAFREVPGLLKLYKDMEIRCPGLKPDIILVDGNGILHPRGFGLASHLGVLINTPTIGVGKTFLHVDGLHKGNIKALITENLNKSKREDHVLIQGHSGKIWGALLWGTVDTMNPIYVSIGHQLSLSTCIEIVKSCCIYRIPEPVRQADLRSRHIIRQWEVSKMVDETLDTYTIHSSSV